MVPGGAWYVARTRHYYLSFSISILSATPPVLKFSLAGLPVLYGLHDERLAGTQGSFITDLYPEEPHRKSEEGQMDWGLRDNHRTLE